MKVSHYWAGSLAVAGILTALCLAGTPAQSDNAAQKETKISPEATEFFESKIRPLLHDRCFSCHGEKQQLGSLRLDSLAHVLKGNSGGPAVVAGEPDRSPLIEVVQYNGKVKMPPSGKLKPEEIAALTAWVKMGAPWPGSEVKSANALKPGELSLEQRRFWSFQPIKKFAPPKVKNTKWVKSPVDAFILAKLEGKGLAPAPPADKRTLLRRVSFDLTGLPPTPAETYAFLLDKSPNAFEKVVDRLLASPRYGERWGRYWLDVARYADTRGYNFVSDSVYHNAYTYRDYVVRAFNDDLPYDQFLTQQIAADLLPQGDDRRPLAALGFLTLGRRFLNDPVLITDDRIDLLSRGIMGISMACARCHDHKFDPLSAKDYYGMYGVLASVNEPDPPLIISPKEIREPYETYQNETTQTKRDLESTIHTQVQRLRNIVAKSPSELKPEIPKTLQAFRIGELPTPDRFAILQTAFEPAANQKITDLKAKQERLAKSPPKPVEFAHGVQETPTPFDPYIFIRGNQNNRGASVKRRFITILGGSDDKPFQKGSGRLELAQAIANKDNPLTARVFVNRVWMYHFGAGIVRTPGDFGTRGELPTHPEMLDYLSAKFMESGWSVKKLQKMMLLTNAYQQASANPNPKAYAADPENRLVWQWNRQRLDLESMRDSLLYASGQMDIAIGGPSIDILKAPFSKRRTVYGFIERQNLPGFFRTFDFASPDLSNVQRFRTTVPQQALYMMNSPFVVEQAQNMAKRPELTKAKTDEERVRAAYLLLFQRSPAPDELQMGLKFLKRPSIGAKQSVWQYGYGAFDEKAGRVAKFTSLPHFTGAAWQGGAAMPDSNLQFLLLNAQGGHPGAASDKAAIRRWTAPADGIVTLKGTLVHPEKRGDGVRARLVSSRTGKLGEWSAANSRAETSMTDIEVKKGDTLDFVVDCHASHEFDGFAWSPSLQMVRTGAKLTGSPEVLSWSAEADFGGPSAVLSAWEKYLQALLMTNEFLFLD